MSDKTVDVTYEGPSGSFAMDDIEVVQGRRTRVPLWWFEKLQTLRNLGPHRMTVHPTEEKGGRR